LGHLGPEQHHGPAQEHARARQRRHGHLHLGRRDHDPEPRADHGDRRLRSPWCALSWPTRPRCAHSWSLRPRARGRAMSEMWDSIVDDSDDSNDNDDTIEIHYSDGTVEVLTNNNNEDEVDEDDDANLDDDE